MFDFSLFLTLFAKTLSSSVAGQLQTGFSSPELRTTACSQHPAALAAGCAGGCRRIWENAEGRTRGTFPLFWCHLLVRAYRNVYWQQEKRRTPVDVVVRPWPWLARGCAQCRAPTASPLLSPGVTAKNWVQQYQNPQAWAAWSQLRTLPALAWCCRDVHRKLGLEFHLLHQSSSAVWSGFSAVL